MRKPSRSIRQYVLVSVGDPHERDLQSLQDLDGEDWGDPDDPVVAPTSLIERCLRLRRMPIGSLSTDDLRLLLHQNVGAVFLVPLALALLEGPRLDYEDETVGDGIDADDEEDLVWALWSLPDTYWSAHSEDFTRFEPWIEMVRPSSGPLVDFARRLGQRQAHWDDQVELS